MGEKLHRYEGESILVTYDAGRCIHAAECVHGLPGVFNPDHRPWVSPDGAGADEVAATVRRCPTGALQYRRLDGVASEAPPTENTVVIAADGPLYAHGDVEVLDGEKSVLLRDTRVAFCRCGDSRYKPFCDGTHSQAGFAASGAIPDPKIRQAETDETGLKVVVASNGPLILEGPVTLRDAAGGDSCSGTKTALCRCGASENKPFCDGTHARIGFAG
jgi:CDGSH-type Zn-finger protein/uncharacterized Fe-S cluster protein YjdI